jgi:hypothetical protein
VQGPGGSIQGQDRIVEGGGLVTAATPHDRGEQQRSEKKLSHGLSPHLVGFFPAGWLSLLLRFRYGFICLLLINAPFEVLMQDVQGLRDLKKRASLAYNNPRFVSRPLLTEKILWPEKVRQVLSD